MTNKIAEFNGIFIKYVETEKYLKIHSLCFLKKMHSALYFKQSNLNCIKLLL